MKTSEISAWKKPVAVENHTPEYTGQYPTLQEAAKPALRVDEFAMIRNPAPKKAPADTLETQNSTEHKASSWFSWIGWPFNK